MASVIAKYTNVSTCRPGSAFDKPAVSMICFAIRTCRTKRAAENVAGRDGLDQLVGVGGLPCIFDSTGMGVCDFDPARTVLGVECRHRVEIEAVVGQHNAQRVLLDFKRGVGDLLGDHGTDQVHDSQRARPDRRTEPIGHRQVRSPCRCRGAGATSSFWRGCPEARVRLAMPALIRMSLMRLWTFWARARSSGSSFRLSSRVAKRSARFMGAPLPCQRRKAQVVRETECPFHP